MIWGIDLCLPLQKKAFFLQFGQEESILGLSFERRAY